MAIVYTTSWEASRNDSYDAREFGTIATVIATAGEVLNPVNVYSALHQTSNAPLPVVGQASPLDSRYFVQSINHRIRGPHFAEIAISYKLGKGSGEQEEEDPLNNPVRYRVRNGITSEATDADVNGNPLLNSAGDPFSGTVQTNISAIFIDAIRNESAYNFPQAIAYTNKVNADVFSLAGYPIQPGEAYCLGIHPESDFKLDDTYVTVVYSFEIRDRLALNNGDRVTAFIHRLLDQGRRGWAYATGDGANIQDIYSKNGDGTDPTQVSSDIRLRDGIPLERDSHITNNPNFDDSDGRGWQAQTPPGKAPGATRDIQATGATFLLYQKHLTANFGALGLP